jgi:hypothetical protein
MDFKRGCFINIVKQAANGMIFYFIIKYSENQGYTKCYKETPEAFQFSRRNS